jgi:ketosteroid isomerase-like protein
MKQPNSLAATLVIVLCIVLIGAVSWGPRPPGPQQLLEIQADAWNSGNLDAFLDTYAGGPRPTYFSGSTVLQGRDQLLEHYRARWAEGEPGRLTFSDLHFERMGQDWALAAGRWHLTQGSGEVKEGLFSAVFHRFPREGWKVIHDHTSSTF